MAAFQNTVAVMYYATCSNRNNKYTFPVYLYTAIIVPCSIDRLVSVIPGTNYQMRQVEASEWELRTTCLGHYLTAFDAYARVAQSNIVMGNT
jgi:hypothetical protein